MRFGVGGAEYEIDLSERNAAKLRKQLAPFVEHARRAGSQPRRPVRTAASRRRSREIRDWAREQGIQLSERGRIPAGIAAQYEADTGRPVRRLAACRQVWMPLRACLRQVGRERMVTITPPLRSQPASCRRIGGVMPPGLGQRSGARDNTWYPDADRGGHAADVLHHRPGANEFCLEG